MPVAAGFILKGAARFSDFLKQAFDAHDRSLVTIVANQIALRSALAI
jgi:hypothetical protein